MLKLSICLARLGNIDEFLTNPVEPRGHVMQVKEWGMLKITLAKVESYLAINVQNTKTAVVDVVKKHSRDKRFLILV